MNSTTTKRRLPYVTGLVVVLVAAVGLVALLDRSTGGVQPVPPQATPDDAIASTRPSPAPARDPEPRAPTSERAEEPAERTSVPAEDDATPRDEECRVFGRTLDERGGPLAGVTVSLDSVGSPWRNTETESESNDDSFETTTNDDGTFELVVPEPDSEWVRLLVRPSTPYHALADRDFGRAGGRDRPSLVPGDNDLGDIALTPTGGIEGVARTTDGGAFVELGERGLGQQSFARLKGVFGRAGRSPLAPDGSFSLPHVAPGSYRLEVFAQGYRLATSPSIDVVAGQTTRGVRIDLEPAPTVAGRVVDAAGEPLADVRVWGWPVGSGRGGGCRTDDEGRFTVHLPQDEPYRFEFEREGYTEIGSSPATTWPPGTRNVRVVLQASERMTFVVVDGATGTPVERFGLAIDAGSRALDERDAPGGRVAVEVASGCGCEVDVQAAGFAPRTVPVRPDEPGGSRQTIELAAGARVRGRVVHAGRGLSGARVSWERSYYKLDPSQPDESPEDQLWSDHYGYDVSEFEGRRRSVVSSADGTFELPNVAAGTYELAVTSPATAPLQLELVVTNGQELELGDLEPLPGASVDGQVLVRASASPAGLSIGLDGRDAITTVDVDGRFELSGLGAGEHRVEVARAPGLLATEARFELAVGVGERTRLVLDLRPLEPATLRLRATSAGAPLADATVRAQPPSGSPTHLGATDERGELVATLTPMHVQSLELTAPSGLPLQRVAQERELAPGEDVTLGVELDLGRLRLSLPAGVDPPADGQGQVVVRHDAHSRPFTVWLAIEGRALHPRRAVPWTASTIDLGQIQPGSVTVDLRAWTADGAPLRLHGSADVAPHGVTVCALELAD